MGWRDFKAVIIEREPREAPDNFSNTKILLIIWGGILFVILWFVVLNKFAVVSGVIAMLSFLFLFAAPLLRNKEMDKEKIIGTLELIEDSIVISTTIPHSTEIILPVSEVTYANIYADVRGKANAADIFMTNQISCRSDILHKGVHYQYNFLCDGLQQKENLSNTFNRWIKQGYKVAILVD